MVNHLHVREPSYVHILIGFAASLVAHEIGHAVGAWLIGMDFSFVIIPFDPRYGPVFMVYLGVQTSVPYAVLAAGPLFAASIMGVVSLWRKECLIAAVWQLVYVLFELFSWRSGLMLAADALTINVVMLVITLIPTLYIGDKILLNMLNKYRSEENG